MEEIETESQTLSLETTGREGEQKEQERKVGTDSPLVKQTQILYKNITKVNTSGIKVEKQLDSKAIMTEALEEKRVKRSPKRRKKDFDLIFDSRYGMCMLQ